MIGWNTNPRGMKKTSVYAISEGELDVPGELRTVAEIKAAIRDKYGYPIDKQHVHHNGKKYVMAQIADASSAQATDCPFVDEFKCHGCPGSAVESLFLVGSTKEQIYERLLPGMGDRHSAIAEERKCVDMAKFGPIADLLQMDAFKEDEFTQVVCEDDLGEFVDNESGYCDYVIEKMAMSAMDMATP